MFDEASTSDKLLIQQLEVQINELRQSHSRRSAELLDVQRTLTEQLAEANATIERFGKEAKNVYSVGSEVLLTGDIVAIVEARIIDRGGVYYTCIWWQDGKRYRETLHESEVKQSCLPH